MVKWEIQVDIYEASFNSFLKVVQTEGEVNRNSETKEVYSFLSSNLYGEFDMQQ